MNETMIDLQQYVDEVRLGLADLDAETREDLTEGLVADLAELVEERGSGALAAPEEYAAELRAAAGLGPATGHVRREWAFPRVVMDAMDSAHAHWDRLLDALPAGGPRGFLTAVQPAWWVARAWLAWMVVQDVRGPYVVLDTDWAVLLGLLVVVSVQVGRRRWGIGRLLTRSVLVRLLLVALNVFAVTMLPGAVDRASAAIAEQRYWTLHEGIVYPDAVNAPRDRAEECPRC